MSPRAKAPPGKDTLDQARVVRDLETIRDGALEAESWVPALRAVELLGRHIGMWRGDARPQTTLAELINQAAEKDDGG